ncbi:hypothetical protein Pint_22504 [Pistacia integerrima]|uniref:Uncharacterized protein n=1 Tax=Pistacia integerrima TaxID=434235 RepID=A0ACC0YMR9_9ROSI|nr:hypothetical protein Pint_22504 [Pistacia integerrima]
MTTEALASRLPTPLPEGELDQIHKEYRLPVGLRVIEGYLSDNPPDCLIAMSKILL